jgi:hypothetical protein
MVYFDCMTKTKKSRHVFLSYSHKDYETVRALWLRLTKAGLDVWLDKDRLQPGQNWKYEIHQAILGSDFFIVCLSQKFMEQSGFRHQELKIALRKVESLPANEAFIIPIRLEVCDMPKTIQHLQRLDLFKRGGYKKLISVLKK